MKIYILPVNKKLRPKKQIFVYPRHNNDYGVEQDFYKYLLRNKHVLVNDPVDADWHYLPIYWTRWHLNHEYGKSGLKELQELVDSIIMEDKKTFTICQYDDGPMVDLGKTFKFLASRKTINDLDAPLLSKKHYIFSFFLKKRYLASFIGRFSTNIIRQQVFDFLKDEDGFLLKDGDFGTSFFKKIICQSYISLCPRGYGGSSFRFFESMQLGVVPFLIGDIDTRPFKKFINWDEISFFSDNPFDIKKIILSKSKDELLKMGNKAKLFFKQNLDYGKWPKYILKELEDIKLN